MVRCRWALGDAVMSDREHLIEAARILRERAEETIYGYGGGNPHDFCPDPECSTPEERERHRLAIEAWDRGEPLPSEPSWTSWPTEDHAKDYVRSCMARGASAATIADTGSLDGPCWTVHCVVGGWGMGVVTIRDPDALNAAELCQRLAEDMPFDDGEDGPF